jgi:hypothetical protein
MVSPAVEKSGEDVSSGAIRNPSHGLARETADIELTIAAAHT